MKKVAIVADGWKKYINYAWIGGCRNYIKEHQLDVCLHVFHSYASFSMDEKYNVGEYNIIELPDFSDYDGIILEFTNITNPVVKGEILRKVRDSGVPTVSLLEDIPGLYFAGTNNFAAMGQMVEHIIRDHGCRILNFVGGPTNNTENMLRYEAYKAILEKYDIPFDGSRVFFKNFEIETGLEGFDYFKNNDRIPEAFICANDNIAVGICYRAKEAGYQVPKDFLVTGFDNFDKASYYDPRISTIGFVREDIAYGALAILDQIWRGQKNQPKYFTRTKCVFQDSCGCMTQTPLNRGQFIVDRIMSEENEAKLQNEMLSLKRELMDCNSFEEMAACIPKHLTTLKYDELYILINHEIAQFTNLSLVESEVDQTYPTKGYPKSMRVLLASMGEFFISNLKRDHGELIPGPATSQKGGDVFLFCPLHFRDREVGYVILKNSDYLMDTQMLFEVLTVIQETMEHMYQRIILRKINDELSTLYIMDSLTGLYNRMAYTKLAVPLFEKCKYQKQPLMIMFVDLDRLKYINDTFGHDMGNLAIKVISESVQNCCPDEGIAMRYGGDEFVVLIPGYNKDAAEELLAEIQKEIALRQDKLTAGFPIDASIGYVITSAESSMNLNDYINLADEQMYAIKKAKKAQRI